jgi:hypothetical protein
VNLKDDFFSSNVEFGHEDVETTMAEEHRQSFKVWPMSFMSGMVAAAALRIAPIDVSEAAIRPAGAVPLSSIDVAAEQSSDVTAVLEQGEDILRRLREGEVHPDLQVLLPMATRIAETQRRDNARDRSAAIDLQLLTKFINNG